jgi:hypothetical protein
MTREELLDAFEKCSFTGHIAKLEIGVDQRQ